MKTKFYYLVLALLALITCSCSAGDEKRIEKEFVKYVQKTFDDPGDFKEIVSIDFAVNVNSDSTIVRMREAYALVDGDDQRRDSIIKADNIDVDGSIYTDRYDYKEFSDESALLILDIALKHFKLEFLIKIRNDDKRDMDVYGLNYRVKRGESSKLRHVTCIVDKTNGNISFYEPGSEPEDLIEYNDMYVRATKMLDSSRKYRDMWNEFYGYE